MSLLIVMVVGCSPQYDWRVIRDDFGGSAMFPGKPVEVTRPIPVEGQKSPVELTLRSAKINETLFAIGSIPRTGESTRRAIEAAMIANIQARPESIQKTTVIIQGLSYADIKARGQMRLSASGAPVEARLWMRSITLDQGSDAERVVEALVVGPASEWSDEQAEQFINGFKPR
jgi:hypothetical protein